MPKIGGLTMYNKNIDTVMTEKKEQIKELEQKIYELKKCMVLDQFDRKKKDAGWTQLEWKLNEMLSMQKLICKYEAQWTMLKKCYFDAC
tara:strand:- start:343 stop:609 length:267 start_codon:yes stop_codon:yes gene_type:complete